MSGTYRSPVTAATLEPLGDTLLRDGDGRLWPVVDGIPYLRVGRDALAAEAVAALQAGDRETALVVLLADQDDWWNGVKPEPDALRRLVRERDRLSLRDAMACLAFDRVGTYFAHRWTDPTFLAGLALIEAHWREPTATAFELACGIGHYGRALTRRGVAFTGGDVVFAKLWLARHWVLPAAAELVCFDAAAPWPVIGRRFDLVLCHDAFYFLDPKPLIRDRLQALAAPTGRVAVSHIHNKGADNLSSGHAVTADDVAQLFPEATVYDDAELTHAFTAGRPPRPDALADLSTVEAFSLEAKSAFLSPNAPHVEHPAQRECRNTQSAPDIVPATARPSSSPDRRAYFDTPPAAAAQDEERGRQAPQNRPEQAHSASLRLNPLYAESHAGWRIVWPSPRYETEYGARATFPLTLDRGFVERLEQARQSGAADDPLLVDALRRRILVDLPERW